MLSSLNTAYFVGSLESILRKALSSVYCSYVEYVESAHF